MVERIRLREGVIDDDGHGNDNRMDITNKFSEKILIFIFFIKNTTIFCF